MQLLVVLMACASFVHAQKVTLGVVTGYSLSSDAPRRTTTYPGGMIDTGETTTTDVSTKPVGRTFLIGPKLELFLPRSFSIEADALYRPLRIEYSYTTNFSGGRRISFSGRQTQVKWEFPILAKYRIERGRVSPFFGAGIVLVPVESGVNLRHYGFAATGGAEIEAGPIVVAPGLRYSRLGPRSGRTTDVNLDQVDLVVALHPSRGHATTPGVFGHRLHLGLLGGVGFGDDLRIPESPFNPATISDSNSAIWGAMLEVDVARHWSIEANGIYRPLHAMDVSQREGREVRWAVLTWEFPILAKYKFLPPGRVQPFATLGPSFRLDGNFNGPRPAHYGVTAGAGVETDLGRLRMAPAIRYTRWAEERGRPSPFSASTFLNQAELLVSFSF